MAVLAVLLVSVGVLAAVGVWCGDWSGRPETTRECTRCGGSGRARMPAAVHKTRCPLCGGRGRRPVQEGAWE